MPDQLPAASRCALCAGDVDGARLTDPETGAELHPACVAERVPAELAALLAETLAVVLAPLIIVWGS